MGNKFEVLESYVMQYGMREVRRQEIVREKVKCFGCRKEEHKKWECPNMRKRKQEEAVLPRKVWKKMKRHSGARGLPPRGATMCMEGWTTRREVVTFVKCRRYNYKGMKTEENREQGFLQKEHVVWKLQGGVELEEWRSKEWKSRESKV